VIAELDAKVVDIARRYLDAVHHGALDDPRVEIRIGDGMAHVCEHAPAAGERYDLIVRLKRPAPGPELASAAEEAASMLATLSLSAATASPAQ